MTDEEGRPTPAVRPVPSPGPEAHPTPTLDRLIQGRIGDHLRAMYDGLIQQPVPDRFQDLIARLEGEPVKSVT